MITIMIIILLLLLQWKSLPSLLLLVALLGDNFSETDAAADRHDCKTRAFINIKAV